MKTFKYDVEPLPHSNSVIDMFNLTHELLTDAGYDHYEISNFGKPGSHSRHNQMYWLGNKDYLAFGCGAASYVNSVRFTRPKQLAKYYRYVDSLPTSYNPTNLFETSNQIASTVLMCGLRTELGINPRERLSHYF